VFGADFSGLDSVVSFDTRLINAIAHNRRGRGRRLGIDHRAFLGGGIAHDVELGRSGSLGPEQKRGKRTANEQIFLQLTSPLQKKAIANVTLWGKFREGLQDGPLPQLHRLTWLNLDGRRPGDKLWFPKMSRAPVSFGAHSLRYGTERSMLKRPPLRTTLEDRLVAWARKVREQADAMKPGPQKDTLLKKASQAEAAARGGALRKPRVGLE
jgi:hypothetical protein